MYDWEIEQKLINSNYNLDSKTYDHICSTSPQIKRVRYNSFANDFEVWTDNNYWKFAVHPCE